MTVLLAPAAPPAQPIALVVFDWEGTLVPLPRPGEPARPVPGAQALLTELAALGITLAVATGKSRRGLDEQLSAFGWQSLFALTRCAGEGPPKPDPALLREICDELAVPAAQTVMIGDTRHDLQMARGAGARALGVLGGLDDADALAQAGAAAVLPEMTLAGEWLIPQVPQALSGLPPGRHWRAVCPIEAVPEQPEGLRFVWHRLRGPDRRIRQPEPAFLVRHRGGVRAYLNRCAHAPVELDWPEGRFFDESGLYLVCATHGAMYRAEDGTCAGGPCHGRSLVTLDVRERAGQVWVAFENGSP
ncbi:MAG: HAD-IA family hydrolase [Betaproteobacteria bacterium]|nr:HAD-IA family hydrolase [Betaproteobacteria bacterium]